MVRCRLFVDLPAELARATRVEAARRGVTISRVASEALESALGIAEAHADRRLEAAARTREIAKKNATRGPRGVRTDDLVARERP